MKKMKLNGKLSLNKETIVKLNDDQMHAVRGGIDIDWPTFNDGCWDETGSATFGDNCEWCGFLHSTDWLHDPNTSVTDPDLALQNAIDAYDTTQGPINFTTTSEAC